VNLVSTQPPIVPPDAGIYTSYVGGLKAIEVYDSSKPLGIRATPTISRINPAILEADYMTEPNIFNAVNKTAQIIMSAGYKIVGDEKSVSFFQEFFDSIGSRGGMLEWEELLHSIFKHQIIFGSAWNEKIPAKRDKNRIVDLQILDPKAMDYAKDGFDNIALDQYGNPFGYTQTLPTNFTLEERVSPPAQVSLGPDQIFFPPDSVAHYKLYTTGDGFYPLGVIEPIHSIISKKLGIETAHANYLKRNGFGKLLATMGNENYNPSPEKIKQALIELQGMSDKSVIATAWWNKLEILQPQGIGELNNYLLYYIDQIITATGLPKAFVTGVGSETNRRTLERQEEVAKITLNDIVRRTLRVLHRDVIDKIAKGNKGINPVRLVWGEISGEELANKAERLSRYAKQGLLTPDDPTEAYIRKIEGLPERDEKTARPIQPNQKPEEKEKDDENKLE